MTPEQLAMARDRVRGICLHASARPSALNGNWFFCPECQGHFEELPAETLLALALEDLDAAEQPGAGDDPAGGDSPSLWSRLLEDGCPLSD